MVEVIGVAGISYDLVLQVDQFPSSDSKTLSQFLGQFPGGFIANATNAIARLGVQTGYVGWLGNDTQGIMLRDRFIEDNIDVQGLRLVEGEDSPFTVIMLNPQGERIILIPDFPLYNQAFDSAQEKYLQEAQLIYTYPKSVDWCRTLQSYAHSSQGHLVLDIEHSSHFTAEELREIIQMTKICFVSDSVMSKLGLMSLADIESEGWVIHTQGKEGAMAYSQSTGIVYEPAQLVDVVDTTGAGDCFHAGVVASFIWNKSLQDALHFASLATSIKIQHLGARNGLPSRSQIDAIL